jgi:hypothetical protein
MRHGDLARVFASFCKKKRFLFFFEKRTKKLPFMILSARPSTPTLIAAPHETLLMCRAFGRGPTL